MNYVKPALVAASGAMAIFAGDVARADSISPLSFSAELDVGESETVRKTVVVEEGSPTDARIDVHFLIDTSGSMGSEVDAAQAAATNLFNSLNSDFGDVQASVGVFAEEATLSSLDPRDNAIIGGGLTDNVTTFQDNVDQVTLGEPDFGGDFPESGYTGIELAGDNLAWRPGSSRFMFVFTDASAKGNFSGAQATIADNSIDMVTLDYGGGTAVENSYGTPLGGDVFSSTATADDIIDDVTGGISAGFANYSTVTVDDLDGGDPLFDVSTVCVSADIGSCTDADATGSFDRSVDRTFEFDVTFTRLAGGDAAFDTYALVDGGIVATEADSFDDVPGTEVPEPASLAILGTGLVAGGLMGRRLRRR